MKLTETHLKEVDDEEQEAIYVYSWTINERVNSALSKALLSKWESETWLGGQHFPHIWWQSNFIIAGN